MAVLITILHIGVGVGLILLILLQAGKGASLSGLFGGGGGEAIFGGGGGDIFLKKLTTIFAILFMLTSLSLAIISAKAHNRTIVKEEPLPKTSQQSLPKESIPASPSIPSPPPSQEEKK